nr:hypothetical protein [Chlamydiota bacterium]
MFVRIKTSKNSPRSSIQICESYRENGKVRQKILRHVGVAQNATHLQELKQLAHYLMLQLKEEREGPYLPSLKTSTPLPLKKMPSEHSEEPITPKLPVDLTDIKEEKRLTEGFHDIFGKLFTELGFHKFVSKRPTKTLLDVL